MRRDETMGRSGATLTDDTVSIVLDTYGDRRTGYFGAYNPDRTIRTFFIPVNGERYFHRQARRAND